MYLQAQAPQEAPQINPIAFHDFEVDQTKMSISEVPQGFKGRAYQFNPSSAVLSISINPTPQGVTVKAFVLSVCAQIIFETERSPIEDHVKIEIEDFHDDSDGWFVFSKINACGANFEVKKVDFDLERKEITIS